MIATAKASIQSNATGKQAPLDLFPMLRQIGPMITEQMIRTPGM